MANKPNINTIQALNGMNTIKKQKQIECTTLANNSKNVLSVTATPVLDKCDREGKFIRMEGVVYVKILYEDNDGNNCVIDNKCNFGEIIDTGDENKDFTCLGDVNLCDLEFSLSNTDEIKCNAVLNFEICVFKENQANIVECNDEDFCILPNEVKISTCVINGREQFAQSYEVDLGKNVVRVLDCYANLIQNNITMENGNLVLDCTINNTIVYEVGDEEININSCVKTFDFKQSIAVENCEEECKALAKVNNLADKLQVICEDVDGSMLAHIDYQILAQYIVIAEKSVQSVFDAYSLTNEISLKNSNQGVLNILNEVFAKEKIETNLVLDKENKTVEKIYSYSCNSIDLTKLITEQDSVVVEGVAYCNIVYENFDRETEQKGTSSVVAEIPFSTKVQMEGIKEDDIIVGKAFADTIDVRIKRSQELDILADIKLNITAMRNENINLVSDIEIGEPKLVNECALSVFVVQQGKTYWDIAKQLSINVEELQKQNADLVLPSENVEKVVYYKQLV